MKIKLSIIIFDIDLGGPKKESRAKGKCWQCADLLNVSLEVPAFAGMTQIVERE